MRNDVPEWFRHWRRERASCRADLRQRIESHVAKGGVVIERCFGYSTAWSLNSRGWIPEKRTPANIAEHLTARAIGFGASHVLIGEATP